MRVESTDIKFFRTHQKQLRIEPYQGICDHVHGNASNKSENVRLGNVFILPST